MNKFKKILSLIVIAIIAVLSNFLRAQDNTISTLYFIDNSPMQHTLNPSFQPEYRFYINFPALSFNRFSIGNSNLTLKDFVKKDGDKTILFLNPEGDKDAFFNKLQKSGTLLSTNVGMNIIGFGFKGKNDKSYYTFGLDAKIEGGFTIPRDFMKLALYGTPDLENNVFDLRNTNLTANAYLDFAFGYSHKINEKWNVGGKVKFLYGIANMNAKFETFDLTAGIDKWTVDGYGSINFSGPFEVIAGEQIDDTEVDLADNLGEYFKPSGLGLGVDLGATFKPIDQLKVSVAITDLGFISWNNNVKNLNYSIDGYEFEGMAIGNVDFKEFSFSDLTDSLLNSLTDAFITDETTTKYKTMTQAKLLVGVEANFFQNKLGVGVLSKTTKYGSKFMEEVTLAVNGRPAQWANITLSYSLIQGRFSTFGFGLGLRSGPFHWMVTADYIPVMYASYTPEGGKKIPIPYNTRGLNLGVGLNIVINNKKDADKDGVIDKYDLCPDTPLGVTVDASGCPIDSDKDGVPDYLDECPDTPIQAYGYVDSKGCPIDSDGDGIPDYIDRCPDTPKEAHSYIDEYGCPLDSDNDGVYDYLDKCPDTPRGVIVDNNGCPVDSDGDGIPDYLDECPNTPKEAFGFIDEKGCPKDTDGDGIPDYLDNCPNTPGVAENNGCPEIKKEVRTLIEKALQGIQFETSKATIKSSSHKLLDDMAIEFMANPEYKIEIQGHTDNTGKADYNQDLSERRAQAVKDYFVKKGVPESRMTSIGYGITKPVADNGTAEGRARNRRVEFLITYEEVHFETVKP